jgi:hypothetical protein
MRKLGTLWVILASALAAQEVVAPTPEQAGPPRGDNADGYNITNSFETGYRFATLAGDEGMYRSQVNFGNGLRLLGSKLTIDSTDGHGRFFDEIVLTTQGLGNDPYESAMLRVRKNRLYRYDLLWRLDDYFNPGLTISQGNHLLDTQRRMQDHNLTLFPDSAFRLFVGYTRNEQDGMALTTVNDFSIAGNEFPLFGNMNRLENEYRLGGELNLFGVKLNVMHGWDNYTEGFATPYVLAGPGEQPLNGTGLSSFERTEPYHGSSPYWNLNLRADRKWISVGARFSYNSGGRNFLFNESALGTIIGAAQNEQIAVAGLGRHPVASGSLTLSLFPTSKLTITNQTSFYNSRFEGDSTYVQFDNATQSAAFLTFEQLGIVTVANATDATWRARKWMGFYAGYHYSERRIRSDELFTEANAQQLFPSELRNHLHVGLAGIRVQPLNGLNVRLEAEVGRADHPFTPAADGSYHALNGLVQYRRKTLTLSAGFNSDYNFNSVSISQYSSKSRSYSADASWAARDWLTFDASYVKMDVDTVAGIAYFALGQFVENGNSVYISNIHFGNLGVRFGIGKRVDLFVGYSRVQDVGDGRSNPLAPAEAQPAVPGIPAFIAAQTFPLTYETPSARLSVKLHERLRWNAGYQHYRYLEEFSVLQNYQAHTGYSSVTWSF